MTGPERRTTMPQASPTPRHSAASVRQASYTPAKARAELAGEWGAWLLYRPPSFWLSAQLLNVGVRPNAVTLASLLLALLPPLIAAATPQHYVIIGLIGIGVATLDCVDGNMARTLDRSTALGQYADFFVDVAFRISIYAAIGLLAAYADPALRHALAWLLGAALLAVFARLCRYYAEYRLQLGDSRDIPAKEAPRLADRLFTVISGIDSLLPVLVIVAGLTGTLTWLMYWLVGYAVADFVHSQVAILLQLRAARQDQRSKRDFSG